MAQLTTAEIEKACENDIVLRLLRDELKFKLRMAFNTIAESIVEEAVVAAAASLHATLVARRDHLADKLVLNLTVDGVKRPPIEERRHG